MSRATEVRRALDGIYRSEWGHVVAALIRRLGDFDLAEDVAQEAFAAAVEQWPLSGVPEFPRAWLVRTAEHKAMDRLRRRSTFERKVLAHADSPLLRAVDHTDLEADDLPDDRLRLIFTCCHPALAPEAQVALTLRTLCGLETHEIARAFLVPPATMAQRLTRTKRKIQAAKIPYVVPEAREIPARLEAVLHVLYLMFNEGYAATGGDSLLRADLTAEAIRLARLLRELMAPRPPADVTALLALMLLHDARRETRIDAEGVTVLLDEQDRTRWNREAIAEALSLVDEAFSNGGADSPFALQAAIAAVHCRAARAEDTDWPEILRLYDRLVRVEPSVVASLNRAAAVAMVHGPQPALELMDAIAAGGDLDHHHLLHAARGELLRRLGLLDEAARSYGRAIALVGNASERRFLERRLAGLGKGDKVTRRCRPQMTQMNATDKAEEGR
jgi:RNA polymerase sigma-70 factor (ECF subfamily)